MKTRFFVVFALLLVCLSALVVSLATYTVSFTVSSVGEVKSVGVVVCWDLGCTQNVTRIDWGVLEPGQTRTVNVYVKSLYTVSARLSVVASNWTPESASSFLVFDATPNNVELLPNQVLAVSLALTVSSNVTNVDSFGFDIVFMA